MTAFGAIERQGPALALYSRSRRERSTGWFRRSFARRAIIACGGMVLAALAGAGSALASEFLLNISGSPAMQYRGECRVQSAEGHIRTIEIQGFVPQRYAFEDPAVSCTVQKWDARGRLRVALIQGRRIIARRETAAAYNWVRVRSDGPWGEARSQRGDQGVRPHAFVPLVPAHPVHPVHPPAASPPVLEIRPSPGLRRPLIPPMRSPFSRRFRGFSH